MNMSIFSFTASVLFGLMTLAFTLVGVSEGDKVAIYLGELMALMTVIFMVVGLILNYIGE